MTAVVLSAYEGLGVADVANSGAAMTQAVALDPTAESFSFREIAARWSIVAGQPPNVMLSALLAAFWRGDLESKGSSLVFRLFPKRGEFIRDGVKQETAVWFNAAGLMAEVVDDGKTETRRHIVATDPVVIDRNDFAAFFSGGEYWPAMAPWDGTDGGLLALSTVALSAWPPITIEHHVSEWRVSRSSFAPWFKACGLVPVVALSDFWPSADEKQVIVELDHSGPLDAIPDETAKVKRSAPSARSKKMPFVIAYLREHYPNGVQEYVVRQNLLADVQQSDRTLKNLSIDTLRIGIRRHNAEVQRRS